MGSQTPRRPPRRAHSDEGKSYIPPENHDNQALIYFLIHVEQMPSLSSYALSPMGIFAELFENLAPPSDPLYHSTDYQRYLSALEHKLESIAYTSDRVQPELKGQMGLSQLANLIYLERISRNCSGPSPKIDKWSATAFEVLAKARPFKHLVLLLLFGLEARTEERRIVILNVVEATSKVMRSRGIPILLNMLQTAWNQDDLMPGSYINYSKKLDFLISSNKGLPAFF